MNDIFTVAERQENSFNEKSLSLGSPFDLGLKVADQLKPLTMDLKAGGQLEANGTLPQLKLFDSSEGKDSGLLKIVDSKAVPDFDTKVEAKTTAAAAALEEPGRVKERHDATAIFPFETIVYDNDTKRMIHQDGYIQEIRKNGMEVHMRPDHTVTVMEGGGAREVKPTYPNQEIRSTKVEDDGTVIYSYQDGKSETYYPMGSHTVKHPDKSLDVYNKDGSYKHYSSRGLAEFDSNGNLVKEYENYPDKTMVRRDANGRVEGTVDADHKVRIFKYDSDGELNLIQGHTGTWKRMADEHGKNVWVNESSGKVWNGEFKVDKEGNLHYAPHDPRAQAWMFTRDGMDLPEKRRK